MNRAFLRRSAVIVGLALLGLGGSTAATPFTRGITYRVRMTSKLPAIMAGAGGADAGPLILARASAVGDRARFDLLAFQPMPNGVSLDDYLLVLDSANTVFVNTEAKTYVDARGMLGSGGLGVLGSMVNGRRGGGGGGRGAGAGSGMPQMDLTGLVTDFQDMGADTTDGKQTRHYRVVAEMMVAAMGRQMPLRIVYDTWTADLPYHIVNPFDLNRARSADDPAAKLTEKLAELLKKVQGTPIKTTTTTTISIDAGGGPMALDFSQTTAITDIKEMDVDSKSLDLPSGFAKKTVGGAD